MVALNETFAKLGQLSPERAQRVAELVEDLAYLEALEDAQDIAAADAAVARIAAGEKPEPYEKVKAELDALYHRG